MAFSDLEILGMSYGYTDETVLGGGAIKGKNCTIKSITEITGGHRVTFEWTLDDGTVQTQTMDVMDGAAPAGTYVDKDQFDDNFDTIPGGNILELSDTVLKAGSVTAVIKDNVITLNGTVAANNYLYIKLSGTMEMVQATGAKAVPDAWAQETVSGLTNGKKYGFAPFCLGGTISSSATAPLMTLKDSSKNTLQSAGALFTYAGGGAFLQLVCGKESTFKDFRMAVMLTEDAVPGQFVNKQIALEAYDEIYGDQIYKISNEASFVQIPATDYDSTKTMYSQGSCVAGGYLYIAFINGSHTYLNKYDISDGTLVDSQQMDAIHHGNDITYNPYDGYLYITDLDSPNVIHKVATDLTYISYVEIDITDVYPGYTGLGAIDFNAKRNVFVCLMRGTKKGYLILDQAMGFVDIIWSTNCGGTYAGLFADDDFIYQASAEPSMVHVIAYNGKYVGRLHDLGKLSIEDNNRWEPESLSIVGNKIYMAYNSPLHNTKTYVDVFDISEKIKALKAKV